MFNFERNFGFTIWGDNPPDVRRKNSLDPELRSRFLTSHLYYFLETRWFKPELLKADEAKLNGKRVDVVEVKVSSYGTPFRYRVFLDEKTHLPMRIGILSNLRNDDMFDWVDLSGYREIGGVKVPTLFSPQSRIWNRILVEINPDYSPEFFERQPDMKAGAFQWRRDGKKQLPTLAASKESSTRLSQEQIVNYIKDLESKENERVLVAGRELINAGEQAVPALLEASKSANPDLRFFAAASLLAINKDLDATIQTMKSLLLDSTLMPDFRQTAAFRLMKSDKGIIELRGLLKHTDVIVRRCVIFAFDELTELTELPEQVEPAILILKELKKDKDEVVRSMAEEILEQIEARLKKP